jgi:LPS export ABC transporter protein LptC
MHMAASLAAFVSFMKANGNFIKSTAVILILTAFTYGGYLLLREAEITMPSLFKPSTGVRLLMSMDGFRFTKSENGRVSWLMKAVSADLYENKEAKMKEIEIFFKSPDKKEAVLRGGSGIMDTVSGNASILRGTREVRIVTSDGYLLTTDSLFWKAGQRLVWTSDPFKLLGSEIYLEGVGLSANVDMRTIVVKKNVKAVLQE